MLYIPRNNFLKRTQWKEQYDAVLDKNKDFTILYKAQTELYILLQFILEILANANGSQYYNKKSQQFRIIRSLAQELITFKN